MSDLKSKEFHVFRIHEFFFESTTNICILRTYFVVRTIVGKDGRIPVILRSQHVIADNNGNSHICNWENPFNFLYTLVYAYCNSKCPET